ncbi:DUF3270 domain-containing protein [Streptococcus iners]|uniref:DUF3270 domain-containing protein n=1 Tax=Streptococcus iners TaxID=3028084 RepID=A0AA97A3A9_9STRE|nr:DUF3270 domain-containing protein [Streptococcus sp. 29887]MCK4026612.1 DUF3270 domain-containing protein [Streptococcus suis]WNY50629.1 DUF3270 domain-containing protein [Streptococcus sp. 29887]
MALRHYQSQEYQYEEYIPKEKNTTVQAYQVKNAKKERINELLFFVNIVLFSLITVIASYIYLALDIPVFLALALASATGLIGFRLVQVGLKKRISNKVKK